MSKHLYLGRPISFPKHSVYCSEDDKNATLYTGPKPPSPSLFSSEKLSVAANTLAKLKNRNPDSALLPFAALSPCGIPLL